MFGALAPRLIDNGWTALLPLLNPGKRPLITAWQRYNKAAPTPAEIERWATTSPWAGIGLAMGPDGVMGIDIDVTDTTTARRAQAATVEICGPTPMIRIGKPPKAMLYYRRAPSLVPPGRAFGQYEIYTLSGQTALFGTHPETLLPYHWPVESPEHVAPWELPVVDTVTLAALQEALAGIIPRPTASTSTGGNGAGRPALGNTGAIDTAHMLRLISDAVDPVAAVATAITSAVEGSRHYTMVAGVAALIIKGFTTAEFIDPVASAYTTATGRDTSTVMAATAWAARTFGEPIPPPDTFALWPRRKGMRGGA
jgi:hypothetical protein